jgi:hypothetical protein
MNLHAKTELLKRFSTAPHVESLRSVIETAFALGVMVDSAKKRAADDLNLSEAGRKAHVAKVAQDNVRPLIEVTAAARKMTRFNADRREALKPPTPPRDDTVGEMRRAELRAFALGLKMAERLPFALKNPEAILDAPAELSGLPEGQFVKVRQTYVAAKFGPEIAEIDILDEDLSTVRAAHDLALNELRSNSGMPEREFARMVEKATRETDGVQ